eukprot:403364992
MRTKQLISSIEKQPLSEDILLNTSKYDETPDDGLNDTDQLELIQQINDDTTDYNQHDFNDDDSASPDFYVHRNKQDSSPQIQFTVEFPESRNSNTGRKFTSSSQLGSSSNGPLNYSITNTSQNQQQQQNVAQQQYYQNFNDQAIDIQRYNSNEKPQNAGIHHQKSLSNSNQYTVNLSSQHYNGPQHYQHKSLSPIQEQSSNTTMNRESLHRMPKDRNDMNSYFSFELKNVISPDMVVHQNYQVDDESESHDQPSEKNQNCNENSPSLNPVEQLKQNLEYLFVYYCDYSLDRGQIFIKQSNFIRLLKDAQIINSQSKLTEKDTILIIAKEMNNPLLKNLDFQSFLNLIVKIALIVQQIENIDSDPKQALQSLLDQNILPLLNFIEISIIQQADLKTASSSQITDNGQFISNVSVGTLNSIDIGDEEIIVLKSIQQVLLEIYHHYFTTNSREHVLKRLFQFLKDFELCPILLNPKTCFMIYYLTVVFQNQQDQSIVERINQISQDLISERSQKQSRYQKQRINQVQSLPENFDLTFDQFLQIFYRVTVTFFDLNSKDKSMLNTKKLLSMLNRMELSKGFNQFVSYQRQFKSINSLYTLTPSKNVLIQLYLNQQQFSSQSELDFYRDQYLPDLDAFTLCKLYIEQSQITDVDQLNRHQQQLLDKEQDQQNVDLYLENNHDILLKIYQFYCSYGDPLNSTKLKSSKLVKLIQDAGVLIDNKQTMNTVLNQSQISSLKNNISFRNKKDSKLERSEVDLIFKKVASKPANKNSTYCDSNSSIVDQNYNQSMLMTRNLQSNGYFKERSQTIKLDNRRLSRQVEISIDQTSLNFQQFKEALFLIAKSIALKQNMNEHVVFINFMNENILPLENKNIDNKQIFSNKIANMLSKIENEQVLILLSDLYTVIYPIYELYADQVSMRGYMIFDQFVKFCTDFSVFPDVLNKSDMHKIFMNLAVDQLQTQSVYSGLGGTPRKAFENSSVIQTHRNTHNQSMLINSKSSLIGSSKSSNKQEVIKVLDAHLFVQALGFSALHIDISSQVKILEDEQESLEKIFMFIEKIAMSEGLKRNKSSSQKIKTQQLEKLDIMQFFRKKYEWYFKIKNQQLELDRSIKVKNPALRALALLDQRQFAQTSLSSRKQSTISYKNNEGQQKFNNSIGKGQNFGINNNQYKVQIERIQQQQKQKTDLFSLVMQGGDSQ